MRVSFVMFALLLAGCAEPTTGAPPQTPTQQAAAAVVASEKCGGKLTNEMNSQLAIAIQEQGSGALQAAEYSYRALWTEAGLDTDAIERDAMCAQIFRNGWLQ